MDISALSVAMSTSKLKLDASLAVMGQTKNFAEQIGEQFIEMVEASAPHPNLGAKIDVSI